MNHRTQVVDPDAGTWNFTYNALGELLTQTDARGVQTSHLYDAIGRLVQRTATNTSALDPSLKAIRDNWYWDRWGRTAATACRLRQRLPVQHEIRHEIWANRSLRRQQALATRPLRMARREW